MKILMVLTSHDQLGNTGRKTGFWLEEFAAPYSCLQRRWRPTNTRFSEGRTATDRSKSDLPENQTDAMARFRTRFGSAAGTLANR